MSERLMGGFDWTDPLAAAEVFTASKRFYRPLLISIAAPVLATLIPGRVFCSWICPAGLLLELTGKLRLLLRLAELPPAEVRFSRVNKYLLLAAGLAVAARDYFIRCACALLPIALFYHLAHNLEHLLMEGPKVAALASDPFGWGWNLLGAQSRRIPPLVSLDNLWIPQILLVLVGHVYSLWAAHRVSHRLFRDRKAALRSQLPMLAGMICFSVFSLWLLKQPMEMRSSAM